MGSWIPAALAISPCWTPRWVGSWMMKNLPTNMDTQNKKRNCAQLDSDSENENGNATVFPRFLIIESTDPDQPLSKLSPFVIEKCILSNVGKRTEKQARNTSPKKSSDRVLSDRLPKGSDDPIQQHNRFHCLDEDMEAENSPAESTNKQGRILKINNKK